MDKHHADFIEANVLQLADPHGEPLKRSKPLFSNTPAPESGDVEDIKHYTLLLNTLTFTMGLDVLADRLQLLSGIPGGLSAEMAELEPRLRLYLDPTLISKMPTPCHPTSLRL